MPSGVYRHYEEYPRPSALEWELMPHESIEAEEHYQRLQHLQDDLFSDCKHEIKFFESSFGDLDTESEFSSERVAWTEPQSYSFTNVDQVQQHFETAGQPRIRHA